MKLWQARVALLIIAALWGYGYIATADAIQNVSVMQMQIVRFGLSVVLLCIFFWKRLQKITKRTWLFGIILGLVFYSGMTIHSTALETTTVSKNAFLVVFFLAIVPVLMYVFFKVKIKLYFVFGIITMLLGFFILVFDINLLDLAGSLASIRGEANLVLGDYLTLLSAVFFAVHIVIIGYFVTKEDPVNLVTIQLGVACLLSLISCLFNGEPIPFINLNYDILIPVLPSILFLGIAACFTFGGQIYVQKFLPASNTALIFSTESMFAAAFSVMLGKEPLTSGLIVGAIVITLGIVWAETGFKFKEETDVEKEIHVITDQYVE